MKALMVLLTIISDVPWYVVLSDKESIKPFQLFVVGKVQTLFPQNRRQLEWLQDAILAKPAQTV